MKKRMLVALALILCAVALSACQSGNDGKYQVVSTSQPQATQNLNLGGAQNNQPTDEPDYDYDDGSYDPSSEEGEGDYLGDFELMGALTQETPVVDTPMPTVRGEYAGATPVVIDPIDKPTPTPVPPLSFTYQVYDATKLRLSFEGPVGWTADDSAGDTYVLTNPDPSMDYAATVSVRAMSVSSDMRKSDLVAEIKGMLGTIGSQGFSKFSPSNTADRNLMESTGVYANYTGTLSDGRQIAGRVHATCIDKVLYTIHISYPQAYTKTYVDNVYDKLRHTIKITQ